jgi:hypothetical protein
VVCHGNGEEVGGYGMVTKSSYIYKSWGNDLHSVNCRPKAWEYDTATSCPTWIADIAGDQNLRGNKTPGCKR